MKYIKIDDITISFNDIPNGLNKGLEVAVYVGDDIESRYMSKDETIELIKYLLETL